MLTFNLSLNTVTDAEMRTSCVLSRQSEPEARIPCESYFISFGGVVDFGVTFISCEKTGVFIEQAMALFYFVATHSGDVGVSKNNCRPLSTIVRIIRVTF